MTMQPITAQLVPLDGIYEPSGIQQLADGRFLVIEDEKDHPFSLITFDAHGQVTTTALSPGFFQAGDAVWKLDDLEGITADQAGNIYALTSHSRNADGDNKKLRNKLARFRIDGHRITEPVVVGGLKQALSEAHPILAEAAASGDAKSEGGLNMEALEISADQQRLLVGFRSPLIDQRAIVATITNPVGVFEQHAAPQISAVLDTLDLNGNGIRAMAYLQALGGFLIVAGPPTRQGICFELWFWNGKPGSTARRVSADGVPGFENTEGVSAATVNGRQMVILVSDDGDRDKGRCAHYRLLDLAQLQIAP